MDPRTAVADALADAGVSLDDRFIKCERGSKATHDHDTRFRKPPNGRNYGVYATASDVLVILDVDDYDDETDKSGLSALAKLPPTFETASPHGGTHRYYAVETTDGGRYPAAVLKDEFGSMNPAPSWGEVRVANQYVVGPGSQLDGCDKDGCDRCDDPDGGRYTVQSETAVASVPADTLLDALRADPKLTEDDERDSDRESGREPAPTPGAVPDDLEGRLDAALEHNDKFARLWRGDTSDYGGDRSRADSALAAYLARYFQGDKRTVRRLMDRSGAEKWAERTDASYRDSVLGAVDVVDDYRDPRKAREPAPSPLDDAPTAGDGGTATATPDATETSGVEYETAPWAVLQTALDDPAIPMTDDPDSEDSITLRDLRASEAAYATWEVLEKTGHDHRLLGVRHGPVYGYEDGVWSRDTGDDLLRQVAVDALGPAFTETVMSNLEQHLRRARTYAADELGAPDETVATESGLLDLTERDTEPLRPADLALHKLPHGFDPDADAPRFKEFIEDSVDPDDHEKLQEYAGYLLWHHAQPFGKALLFVGPTDSGKGTFIRILKGVIGADALASESMADLTDSRWGAAQLYGKWANLRNEVTPEEVKKVERFKELTGGEDRISAEFKGEQKFEFDVTQKFAFSMNQMPEVKGADGAFWNRLLFVEFPETVPEDEQVKELDKKIIENEAPGVLNWMLEGLNRLLDQGRFTNQRTTDEKKELCNAFGGAFDRFIRDAVEITGDDDDAVVKKDLHQLAQAFADYNDMEPDWNAQRGFTRMLKSQQGIGDMRTRHLGSDNDRDDVYLGIKPLPHVIDELNADVKHGSIFSSDGQQGTLD